jgi:hypothetical protein
MRSYELTKKGVASRIYDTQVTHSRTRGHRPPEYTRKELREWLFSQVIFHELYSEWVNSDYGKEIKPSVDRKEDDVHYCMSNIQLMTWCENRQKHQDNMKAGIDTRTSKNVTQLNMDGSFVATYFSQSEAFRQTGIDRKTIRNCITGKFKQAGGFTWIKGVLDESN